VAYRSDGKCSLENRDVACDLDVRINHLTKSNQLAPVSRQFEAYRDEDRWLRTVQVVLPAFCISTVPV